MSASISSSESSTPPPSDKATSPKKKMGGCLKWGGIGFAVLLVVGAIASFFDDSTEQDATSPEPTTSVSSESSAPSSESSSQQASSEAAPSPSSETSTPSPSSEEQTPSPSAIDGVDLSLAPQDWFDEEIYKANDCSSQDLAAGGLPVCAIRGVDTEDGGTRFVGYVDQDRPGVQEHFQSEIVRTEMADSVASMIWMAKSDGDPRVQHVTDVRLVATGGDGMLSGWSSDAEVPK